MNDNLEYAVWAQGGDKLRKGQQARNILHGEPKPKTTTNVASNNLDKA